jgi:predicted RNA-binding Zn-ribbon protein involved in translation (DUF1610 family)
MVRSATSVTSKPDKPAPVLWCPICGSLLVYRQTVISGVQPPERLDYFECCMCGPFEYRHRTQQLRPTLSRV